MVGISDINLQGPLGEKKNMADNNNWRPWSELPGALLDLITKPLSAIEYLMFGCVCSTWRSFVAEYRREFMASQPPLALFLSKNARIAYFYSLFDQRLYKKIFPNVTGKSCSGITCGYFVLEDKYRTADSQIWLMNPFTGHELYFPRPPKQFCRVILASLAMPLPQYVLIAFSIWCPYLRFCRSTDINWTVYDYSGKFDESQENNHWKIIDGVVFKGKIYVTTTHAKTGVLNLNSHPYVTLLKVNRNAKLKRGIWRFLVSGEQHLMIYAISCRKHTVYELNFSTMKWVKMQNFGDQALFFDFPQSAGIFSIAQLTGGLSSDYIYEIGSWSGLYTSHFLDARDSMSQLICWEVCQLQVLLNLTHSGIFHICLAVWILSLMTS